MMSLTWRDHLGRTRSRCVPGCAYLLDVFVRDRPDADVRQTDICFKCHRELRWNGRTYHYNHVEGAPILVAEPSSPLSIPGKIWRPKEATTP